MNKKSISLLGLCLAGLLVAILRKTLYLEIMDERGLIPFWHPLHLFLLVIVALLGLTYFLLMRHPGTPPEFPQIGLIPGIACLLLAAAAGYSAYLGNLGSFPQATRAAGVLAAVCLAGMAVYFFAGKPAPAWMFGVISLFFAVILIGMYRVWSGNPQTHNYIFNLLGGICAMLAAYHSAAALKGKAHNSKGMTLCVLGSFCCFAGIYGASHPWLWFCIGLWLMSCLFLPLPAKKEGNP